MTEVKPEGYPSFPQTHDTSKISKKSTGKRKYHKKSRKGCLTCKKRRVKCDEHKPICENCDRMDIECVYLSNSNSNSNANGSDSDGSIPHIHKTSSSTTPLPTTTPYNDNNLISSQFDENNAPNSPFSSILAAAATAAANTTESFNSTDPDYNNNPQLPAIAAAVAAAANIPLAASQRQFTQDPNLNVATSTINLGFGNFNIKPEHLKMFASLPPEEAAKLQQQFLSGQSLSLPFGSLKDTAKIANGTATSPAVPIANSHSQNEQPIKAEPHLSPSIVDSPPITAASISPSLSYSGYSEPLNMLDLRLMYHYTTKVWPTITAAGISEERIWSEDIPMLAFKYPFLMHSVLAFSATHLSRTERGLDQCVTCHRADALKLLGEAVLEMSPENTDALVASALILIMDSLANASLPTSTSPKSLPPSAWIFHVKGAATILTAVWPLSETSRFYKFISVDLGDLGEIGYDLVSGQLSPNSPASKDDKNPSGSSSTTMNMNPEAMKYSSIQCFDDEIMDLFPLEYTSPYLPTLAYMNKLYRERNKSDFILRVFAFPALLDKRFLSLLISCDLSAMRIMRCYYKLLRNFTAEMKNKVWFLEGVSKVLPVDVEEYAGGGGMHMMLDFLGGPSTHNDNNFNDIANNAAQSGLLDTNNLPSSAVSAVARNGNPNGVNNTNNNNNDDDDDDLISKSLGLSDDGNTNEFI